VSSTTLVAPVPGQAEDAGSDHAECGSLACAAVLRTVYPGALLPVLNNSSAQQLEALVGRWFPKVQTLLVAENLADVVAEQVIKLGRYVIGLVHCTGEAVPCPPPGEAAHWIAVYAVSGANALYYQCWTANEQSISAAALAAASDGTGPHLVIWFDEEAAVARSTATVVIRDGDSIDPLGAGAVYLVEDIVDGPKRHITANGNLAGYLADCGQTAPLPIDAYALDRMERGPDIDGSITSPPEV
jgi:hypothetical protein